MDDELLLRQIFGPSEYRRFFSISAVFEVLGKGFSTFFFDAYKYSIQTLNSLTLKTNIFHSLMFYEIHISI